jgi:hypothetical protein
MILENRYRDHCPTGVAVDVQLPLDYYHIAMQALDGDKLWLS